MICDLKKWFIRSGLRNLWKDFESIEIYEILPYFHRAPEILNPRNVYETSRFHLLRDFSQ